MDHYSHDGLTFEVTDTGPTDGRAVILLHGFPEDRHCWDRLAASLADAGYRALAPDQRGYSPGPGRPGGAPTPSTCWPATSWRWRTPPGRTASTSSATTGVRRWPGTWRRAPRPGPQPDGPVGPASPGPCGSHVPQSPAAAVVVHAVLPDPGGAGADPLAGRGQPPRRPTPAHRSRRRLGPPVRPAGRHAGALTGPINWYRALPFDIAQPGRPGWRADAVRLGRARPVRHRDGRRAVRPPRHRAVPLRRPAGGRPLAAFRLGPAVAPPLLRHLGDTGDG